MSIYARAGAAYAVYTMMNFGDLSETEFLRYYTRAAAYLSAVTRGRADGILLAVTEVGTDSADAGGLLAEKVLLAAFAVAEQYRLLALNDGAGPVVAESNDGISITYASGRTGLGNSGTGGGAGSQTPEEKLYQAAAQYLRGSGLLYRGCGKCS